MDILIRMFTGVLFKLPPDTVKLAIDKALDVIEDKITASENKVDDRFILPAIQWLRDQLGIAETPGSQFADPAKPPTP